MDPAEPHVSVGIEDGAVDRRGVVSREWLTADIHAWHRNIIEFCQRPYRTADGQMDVLAMNDDLVRRWNETVAPDDVVRVIGDFALCNRKRLVEFTMRLNGHKLLIRGNHDKHTKAAYREAGFEDVVDHLYDGSTLYIHNPYQGLRWHSRAKLIICGHVHDLWTTMDRCINVGVDVRGYRPVSLAEVLPAANEPCATEEARTREEGWRRTQARRRRVRRA